MPVYSVVHKAKQKKKVERMQAVVDEHSQLYSKVGKVNKKTEDESPSGNDVASTQTSVSVVTRLPAHETRGSVMEGGYESINYDDPLKGDGDYDSVGEDFGYDTVDVVTKKALGDHLSSVAPQRHASEHIYDMVPEHVGELTDLRSLPLNDYDDISEVPGLESDVTASS